MINDFHCLYINLDDRPDKRDIAEKEFAKHGINVERVSGIKGNPSGLQTVGKPGDVGCTLSHVKCVQIAKDRGWSEVVIFEDDATFKDGFNVLFDNYFSQVPSDWEMVYFGGNHWGRDLKMKYNPQLTRVSPNIARTTHTLTTHAYIIRDSMYDAVIEHLGKASKQVDVMYADLQSSYNVYTFRPSLVWQIPCRSDINGKDCDYVYFLRDW